MNQTLVGTYAITNKVAEKTSEYKVLISTDAEVKAGSVEILAFVSAVGQSIGDIISIKDFF